jgi:hypothetical protein
MAMRVIAKATSLYLKKLKTARIRAAAGITSRMSKLDVICQSYSRLLDYLSI